MLTRHDVSQPVSLEVGILKDEPHSLHIRNTLSGLVSERNELHPDLCISKKSTIIAVNGVNNDARQMRNLLRDDLCLQITVRQPVLCRYFGDECRNCLDTLEDLSSLPLQGMCFLILFALVF